MPTTLNSKIPLPTSEQDSAKVATYNAAHHEVEKLNTGFLPLAIDGTGDVPLATFGRDQALNRLLKFTGVLTGNRTVKMPVALGCARHFTVWNATTGAFTLTIITTAGGSTGVVVTQIGRAHV